MHRIMHVLDYEKRIGRKPDGKQMNKSILLFSSQRSTYPTTPYMGQLWSMMIARDRMGQTRTLANLA